MAAQAKPTTQIREKWNHMSDNCSQNVIPTTTKIYHALLHFMQLAQARVVVEAACEPGSEAAY